MNCEHCGKPVDPRTTKYWRYVDDVKIWFCGCMCGTEWYETWRRLKK